jgi:hypothetical protein
VPPPASAARERCFVAVAFLLLSWSIFPWIPGRSVVLPADYLRLLPPWKVSGARVANPTLTDALWQFYPWQDELARSVRRGRFPLWDPSVQTGVPVAANPQAAYFFPLTWLSVLLGAGAGMSLQAVLRPALAAWLGYLYLRRRRGAWPSIFGGATFGFSLPFLVWAEHPHDNAFLLIPAVLLAIDGVLARGRLRDAALLGICGALLALAGHPESAMQVALLAAAYAAVRLRRAPRPLRSLGLFAASSAAAAAASLFALYPSWLLVRSSVSWQSGSHAAFGLPLRALALALRPRLFGSPGRPASFSGLTVAFSESALFVGILALSLLPVAALRRGRREPDEAPAALWWGAIGACLALVFVAPRWAGFADVPLLGKMFVTRLSVVAAFAVSVLASGALEALARDGRARRAWRVCLPLAVAATAAAPILVGGRVLGADLAWAAALSTAALAVTGTLGRRPTLALALLAALQCADLGRAAAGFHTISPESSVFPPVPEIATLRKAEGADRFLAIGATFPPNSATVYGARDVRGFDALEGVRFRAARQSLALWSRRPGFPAMTAAGLTPDSGRLLALFAVRALLLPPNVRMDPAAAARLGLDVALVEAGRHATVYRILGGRGRVQTVARVLPSSGPIPGSSPGRSHRNAAFVEGIAAGADFPAAQSARAEIVRDLPERLTLRVNASGPVFVRVADADAPGWRAYLDGRPTRLLRTDSVFRGVLVPAGLHRVEMRYRLPGMPATGLLAAVVLALLAATAMFAGRDVR